MNKNILKSIIGCAILTISSVGTFASQMPQTDTSGVSPIEIYKSQQLKRLKDDDYKIIPGGKGTLYSNSWRSTSPTSSGNIYKWDYQVSAVYEGDRAVEWIRTTWQGSASLRNSASISLGISDSEVSVGASSSWQTANTVSKYWENTKGQKIADYGSNMIVTPSKDYRTGTISIANTAKVKLVDDAKTYEITSGV